MRGKARPDPLFAPSEVGSATQPRPVGCEDCFNEILSRDPGIGKGKTDRRFRMQVTRQV
jgi:hypothetical protein